jgi:hypothetical protein
MLFDKFLMMEEIDLRALAPDALTKSRDFQMYMDGFIGIGRQLRLLTMPVILQVDDILIPSRIEV